MPSKKQLGEPSEANKKIGGVPVIHYYDFQSRGRGEVMRLFMHDAGIAFHDVRYSFEEYNSKTAESKAKDNAAQTLPYIELGGQLLTQTYSILRLWSAQLGDYDGKTVEERYFVDRICDYAADWRTHFVDGAFHLQSGQNKEEKFVPRDDSKPFEQHKQVFVPRYSGGLEKLLSQSPSAKGGPFVLGSRITYADFVIWQIMHDENKYPPELDLSKTPRLKELYEGLKSRPQISKYLASEHYLD